MCTSRILAKSTMGLIVECSECRSIQLNFGTGQMAFSVISYRMFVEEVISKVQSNQISSNPKAKTILLQHPDFAGFSYVLTLNELEHLIDLVQMAELMRETYTILQQNEQ